jgi:phosphorylcholine metabolism protein LicD
MTVIPKEAEKFLLPDKIKKQLFYMFRDVIKLLNRAKVQWWAEGGTLLGAIRHKNIIPWDDDIDIGILETENLDIPKILNKLDSLLTFTPTFFGYKVFLKRGGKKLYTYGKEKDFTYPGLDIFVFIKKGNKIIYKEEKPREYWKKYQWSQEILFPLKKYQFGPLKIPGANQVEKYLDKAFGKSWRTKGKIYYNHSTERWLKNPIEFNL